MSEYHKANKQSTAKRNNVLSKNESGNLKQTLKDGFLDFCTAAGVVALYELMEEDVARVEEPKGKHIAEREAYRHGFESTSVTMAGTKIPIDRPRARTVDGQEVEIESLELARNNDLLYETALARMLHGLSS